MSVNRTYKLPWKQLDAQDIELAAAAVAVSIPGLGVEVERSSGGVRCYFAVPREVARKWEGPTLDKCFQPGQPPVAEPLLIEVGFSHLPQEANDPNELFLMSIDMGYCANEMLWTLAVEIMDRFCRHWGIDPE